MAKIVGLSAYYHDSAAALVVDGAIVAAAQEERFTRKKHDERFPKNALAFCMRQASITIDEVDFFVYYEKPFLKFERLIETYLNFAPHGFRSFRRSMPLWLKEKLFQKALLAKELRAMGASKSVREKILFSEHHLSHAASAFFPSPFREAAVLTMDGVGEWATTSIAVGSGDDLSILKEIHFPDSLGLLYSAFTHYTGFKVNSGEYKVMGLAPYGSPRFAQKILDRLIDVKADGSFRLNQEYFDYCTGLRMINRRFEDLFGIPARNPNEPLTQDHMDLAASIQHVTEEIVLRIARNVARETGQQYLCLAGGVALNCVANGKVLRDKAFKEVWVQPASGDAGGALGAALAAHHIHLGGTLTPNGAGDRMMGSYLGPEFGQDDIERTLKTLGASYRVLPEDQLLETCSALLTEEKVLGWFQGRMEFGPRALGNRSILADARSPRMQSLLNLKIKFRESFRPFAPSVLYEDLGEWFEMEEASPYMLLVAEIARRKRVGTGAAEDGLFGIEKLKVKRSEIPAVTHVDYSARIQTVHRETNPRYHALIASFKRRTGCPVVANTSFNVRGEPIVCTPEDAFRCFMGTDIDALAIGNCVLLKGEQDQRLGEDYKDRFDLD